MKTKDQLIKEIAILEEKNKQLLKQDLDVRTDLSALLGKHYFESESWGGESEKKVDVQTWIGIAFLIGELKADAHYSLVLESKKHLETNIDMLRGTIQKMREDSENKHNTN